MGDQWEGVPMSSNNVLGEPMSWETNENGANEMGDQWDGGPVSGSQLGERRQQPF